MLLALSGAYCLHGMQGSFRITHLNLSHNHFSEEGGVILGAALGKCVVFSLSQSKQNRLTGLTKSLFGAIKFNYLPLFLF